MFSTKVLPNLSTNPFVLVGLTVREPRYFEIALSTPELPTITVHQNLLNVSWNSELLSLHDAQFGTPTISNLHKTRHEAPSNFVDVFRKPQSRRDKSASSGAASGTLIIINNDSVT